MLFKIAALWNIVNGTFVLLMPQLFLSLVYHYEGPVAGPLLTFYRLFWCVVVIFGAGYWRAASDFAAYRGVVMLGAVGKPIIACYWLAEVAMGIASPLILGGALGDLAFAALFVRALLRPLRTDGQPLRGPAGA